MCYLGVIVDLLWSTSDFNDPIVLLRCLVCETLYVCHYHDCNFVEAPKLNDVFLFEIEFGRRGKLLEVTRKFFLFSMIYNCSFLFLEILQRQQTFDVENCL